MRIRSHPERFFEAFSGLAERVTASAGLLRDLLADPAHGDDAQARLAVLQQEAEALREQVLVDSAAVPVAPLPREDIHSITLLLTELVSMLHDGAGRARNLGLTHPREPAARLAEVLVRAAQCIEQSVAGFAERRLSGERCSDMEPLAHEGQAIYDGAVEALFAGSPDPVEVIRWKEVYDLLEQAMEQCSRVENALSGIAQENRA
jgi:uncharacterized protein Yka (UPF0111/DUF47 family)